MELNIPSFLIISTTSLDDTVGDPPSCGLLVDASIIMTIGNVIIVVLRHLAAVIIVLAVKTPFRITASDTSIRCLLYTSPSPRD